MELTAKLAALLLSLVLVAPMLLSVAPPPRAEWPATSSQERISATMLGLRKTYLGRALFVLAALALVMSAQAPPAGRAAEAAVYTGYYNLLGYEGIPTLGSTGFTNGQAPPAGDYVTTHCRYINVQNTLVNHYFLRYPLDLPGGANITKISLRVADFNPTGNLLALLRSRPWNSRNAGSTLHSTLTDNSANSDKTIEMIFNTPVTVNNQTTQYWIDVSPQNGNDPGQLCVYGIQVTYTIDGVFLPFIQRGG